MNATTRTTTLAAVLFLGLTASTARADTFTLDLPELTGTFVHGQSSISAVVDFGVGFENPVVYLEITATGIPGFSSDTGAFPAELLVSVITLGQAIIPPTVLTPFGASPTVLGFSSGVGELTGDLDADGLTDGSGVFEIVLDTNDIYTGIVTPASLEITRVEIFVHEQEIWGCFNCGYIGIAELNIVLSNWNMNVPPADPLADWSGDGYVGIEDLNAVLSQWNAGTPPTAGAVPEPGTIVLMGVGMLVLNRRHPKC